MVAHLDSVTSLAIDPNGLYLLSGSKYRNTLDYTIDVKKKGKFSSNTYKLKI